MQFFEITYNDGSVDKVKRVSRKQLQDLIILQQDLIEAFLKNNASVGSIIADDAIWSSIEKLSNILPTVGNDTPGIKLEKLEDDLTQLTKIFFTESVDENGLPISPKNIQDEWYQPSLISKLHQLDYYGATQKAIKNLNPEALQ